jgi:trans-aconitate methyltransferase
MYQWDAVDYQKTSAEQQRWGLELLDRIALSGNEHVLDIGCGDGKLTAEIARRVPFGSVLGVDKSKDMICFSREHYRINAFPNLAFRLLDARDLHFDQDFDVVFSNATLHWIDDHANILLRIRKSLLVGGRVIAQMGGKGNAATILKILSTIMSSEKWVKYFNDFSIPYTFYDAQEYRLLLESAGFAVKRIEIIPKLMAHRGKEGLSSWIRTTWLPYTRRVPEDLQADFIREIVDTYMATQGFDKNDTIRVEMVRLEFDAEKVPNRDR